MAKNVLPVDFQDDILSEDMDGRRKYQMITNADGTVSFVDVTEYTQVGSNFGQAQINATNEAVNESADKNKIIDTKADLMANTQAGMIAGASAVKAAVSELTENEIITVSPIPELKISNSKVEVRAGIALVNIQILCAGTTSVSLSNGKILATGFPKPSSGIAIVTHGIPWNNGFIGSDARTTPLRLCIDGSGKLCCFYPSDKEQITVGMPVNINCSYSVAD